MCHLLNENLTTVRTPSRVFSRWLRTDNVKWRYECYRTEEDIGPVGSFLYAVRSEGMGL